MTAHDPLEEALGGLRREYLAEAPARMLELRKEYAAILAGERDAAASLKGRLHKLAGSGGSYGFPQISEIARRGENWLTANLSDCSKAAEMIGPLLEELEATFQGAQGGLGASAIESPRLLDFGWHALILGASRPLGGTLAARLEAVGFDVIVADVGAPQARPVSSV